MSKVIKPADLVRLKAETVPSPASPELEALVAPTAEDLMNLTLAAFADVEPSLDLDQNQRDLLHTALRERLTAVLTGQSHEAGVPSNGVGDP